MKKNNVLLSFVIILLIMFTWTGFAQEITKSIEVVFNSISIEVDEKIIYSDGEPFIYNNRIYAPVRFVVEAMGGEVTWDGVNNRVVAKSYNDFPDCDYLKGEIFVYGLITDIDYVEKEITVEQHYDDNSVSVESPLRVIDNVIIILQRNEKKMNLDFEDLKIGEDVGLVVNSENLVRGIILSK